MNIVEIYDKYFDLNTKRIFAVLSEQAKIFGVRIFLIGGLVRDMLLDKKSQDIDITVEGNAIDFAKFLQKAEVAKIKNAYKEFQTVKIDINGTKIDLASTRSEYYPQKGHLPVVQSIGCALEQDILRRDFTINSLGLSLNKSDFLELKDFVGGVQDLKNKKIRILHDKSFIDDPTRIIRALKYAHRFGFSIEEQTKKLQQDYLNNINYDMCKKRILQEFKKTFSAKNPPYKEFIEQNIYKLMTSDKVSELSLKKNNFNELSWLVYFALIMDCDTESFELKKREINILQRVKEVENIKFKTDFEIYKNFHSLPEQSIQILLCKDNVYAKKFDNDLKNIKIEISGKDLINAGIEPSKEFGLIFDYLIKEKINNPNLTKDEELTMVKEFLRYKH